VSFSGWGTVRSEDGKIYAGKLDEVELFGARFCRVMAPGAKPDEWRGETLIGGAAVRQLYAAPEADVRKLCGAVVAAEGGAKAENASEAKHETPPEAKPTAASEEAAP
jgi:hypothetical protein